jgi:peptide/nickel transport system permease protein
MGNMALREYALKRIMHMAMVFWAFFTILFILFRAVPGDPTSLYVRQGLTGEERQEMIARLGLNKPLHEQYIDYIFQLLTGSFGESFTYNDPVIEVLIPRFLNTAILMGSGLIIAYIFAITFGALLAWWRDSTFEHLGIVIALVARSSPQFWIGIVLILVFSFHFDLLPTGGLRTPGQDVSSFVAMYLNMDFVRHAVLPVLTVAIYYMAAPALLMRTSMLKVLNSGFIEIKKAEGLSPFVVIYKHAVRNSLLPVVTLAAVVFSTVFGGAVVIETVFSWPGMGREMVTAVRQNDYPLAMAAFFIMGCIVITMNFVADLMYAYLDPRVSYE